LKTLKHVQHEGNLALTFEAAHQLDADDPLAFARDRFRLPDATIYLDGNSLGALPKATSPHVVEVLERQWGDDLITSWNKHGWIEWPQRIAAKLAPIVGADPNELLIADSTTVCLFKLLAAAVAARPGRPIILTQQNNFPTDIYAAEGLARLLPNLHVRAVPAAEIEEALCDDVAVLLLTHVDYRSGARHDMPALNAAAHALGAVVLWDLSHSAGALELNLNEAGCDLAVGCGYKYLNGGPGAPAFLYVSRELQSELRCPLSGWMGHADPFAFEASFRPAGGIAQFLTGTPSVLALAALEAGLDTFDGLRIRAVQDKAMRLTQFFIDCVEQRCGDQVRLASPREAEQRGSHVSFANPNGYAVMQALIARGMIGDFRAPDLMRFGFAPLYNRFVEGWCAADAIGQILETGEWHQPRFMTRQKVT
jgi:kynureninase